MTGPVSTPPTTTPPPSPTLTQVLLLKAPRIRGALEVGSRARVTAGRWNPGDVSLTYRWFVGGTRVAKADGRTLRLKEKWEGRRLRVRVVAEAEGYLARTVVTRRSARITPD